MLRFQEYHHLYEDEQIIAYAFGDSLHIRYMVLYTSEHVIRIITEEKYTLCRITHSLPWFRGDLTMKLQQVGQLLYI
jgi:hypothetical protein